MTRGATRSRPAEPDGEPPASGGGATGRDDALRLEHDRLAERLSARRSIELVRRGVYAGFTGFIASGLALKLAFDRWFSAVATRFTGPPVYFFAALAVAVVLLALAAGCFLRARRHMSEEDALFARMKELRLRLELDP